MSIEAMIRHHRRRLLLAIVGCIVWATVEQIVKLFNPKPKEQKP